MENTDYHIITKILGLAVIIFFLLLCKSSDQEYKKEKKYKKFNQ